MKIADRVEQIVHGTLDGKGPGKEDCVYLLGLEPHSRESTYLMSAANGICRSRMDNLGILYAQIGIDVGPCSADCSFCSFAASHFDAEPYRMTPEQVAEAAGKLGADGDLFGVFLMTMHGFDVAYLVEAVRAAREALPAQTQVWLNVGDMSLEQATALRDSGAQGAYHVLRIGEGTDTKLKPERRLKTFSAIRDAGLALFTCCEPIGAEHTPDQIVEHMFLGFEQQCSQLSAMRRVTLPHLPLAHHGQISQLRLAQIVAVTTLASVSFPSVFAIAHHEPNLLALTAGSNIIGAEWGPNPRDAAPSQAGGLALSVNDCRRMLFEAGFRAILAGDLQQIPLHGN